MIKTLRITGIVTRIGIIKTLRITGIVTAVLAVLSVVFLVVVGVRGDERIGKLTKIPGIIEQFKSAKGSKPRVNTNQKSPLVVQAQLFARYLNPPKRPTPPKRPLNTKTVDMLQKKVATAARFRVVLTSYSEENPELSRALIDEPGSGLRWVMIDSQVGHLQIGRIEDGVVVAMSGQETFRVGIEVAAQGPSLVLGPRPVSTSNVPKPPQTSVTTIRNTPPAPKSRITPQTRSGPPQPRTREQQNSVMEMMRDRMKGMRSSDKTDKGGSKGGSTISREMMLKLMEQFGGSRISAEEAEKLDNMGKNLKNGQSDPNRARGGGSKIESRPSSPTRPSRPSSR